MRSDGRLPSPETPRRSAGQALAAIRLTPRLRTVGLALLIAATSLAVGSVSAWLVPPYLILMAWLLLAPARPTAAGAEPASVERTAAEPQAATPATGMAGEEPSPTRAKTKAHAAEVGESSPSDPNGPATEAASQVATVPEASPKPRRGRGGRGRGKKAAASATPEPVAVKWVRVGPGQFVRVEEPLPASAEGELKAEPPPEAAPTDQAATTVTAEPAGSDAGEIKPDEGEASRTESDEPAADDAASPGVLPGFDARCLDDPVGPDPAGVEDVPIGPVQRPEAGDVGEPAAASSGGSDLPQTEEQDGPVDVAEAGLPAAVVVEEAVTPPEFDGEPPPVPETFERPMEPMPATVVEGPSPAGSEARPLATETVVLASGPRRPCRSWPSEQPRLTIPTRGRRPELRARRPSRLRGRPGRGPRSSHRRFCRTHRTFKPRAPPACRPHRMARRPHTRAAKGSIRHVRPGPRHGHGRSGPPAAGTPGRRPAFGGWTADG